MLYLFFWPLIKDFFHIYTGQFLIVRWYGCSSKRQNIQFYVF